MKSGGGAKRSETSLDSSKNNSTSNSDNSKETSETEKTKSKNLKTKPANLAKIALMTALSSTKEETAIGTAGRRSEKAQLTTMSLILGKKRSTAI